MLPLYITIPLAALAIAWILWELKRANGYEEYLSVNKKGELVEGLRKTEINETNNSLREAL